MVSRSLGRRIARVLGYLVATLAMLLVIAIAALQTRWARSWLRGRVEAKLAAAFDGRATLGALDYSLLFSHVELDNVEIRDRAGRVAVRVAAIEAELDRGSLVRGAPVIDELVITGLAITAVVDATGHTNLADLATSPGQPPRASLAIRAFAITGAATLTARNGTVVTASEIELHGSLAVRPLANDL